MTGSRAVRGAAGRPTVRAIAAGQVGPHLLRGAVGAESLPSGWHLATAVLALVGLAAVVFATRGRPGVSSRRRMGLDPEARFARPADLAALWVPGRVAGRVTLGWISGMLGRRQLVATEVSRRAAGVGVPWWLRGRAARRRGPRGAVLVVGPSQCGKTAALAIPAILEWDGPVIALSVKEDLLGASICRRRAVGEVLVFDPAGATNETTATWSPLREATDLAGARRAARGLANATRWSSESSADMSFWTAAGEDLLALLFWTGASLGVGMDSVVGWVQTMDRRVRGLIAPLAVHPDPVVAGQAVQVLDGLDGLWRNDPKQISSIYLVARQMIQPWQEPDVAASAIRPGVDLDWLLGTSQATGRIGTANTLYLSADLDEADRLAPVLGGLVDDLFKQIYARVGRTGTPLDPPVLIVIDEAGNWPMRNLPGRISTCAGLGVQLVLVFQSKAQIDAAYGSRADIVVSNAITKVFFAGVSDRSTLDYAAGLLGQEHIPSRSTSDEVGGLLRGSAAGRRTVSVGPTRLELLPAPLLRQLVPGEALLIHNTLPPAHLRGRYWYLEPDLYALATGESRSRRSLAKLAGRPAGADDRDHAEAASDVATDVTADAIPPAQPSAPLSWPLEDDPWWGDAR